MEPCVPQECFSELEAYSVFKSRPRNILRDTHIPGSGYNSQSMGL